MKKLSAVFVLTFALSLASHAATTHLTGAWWDTVTRGFTRQAGEIDIDVDDAGLCYVTIYWDGRVWESPVGTAVVKRINGIKYVVLRWTDSTGTSYTAKSRYGSDRVSGSYSRGIYYKGSMQLSLGIQDTPELDAPAKQKPANGPK